MGFRFPLSKPRAFLAGGDLLTIAPELLANLDTTLGTVARTRSAAEAHASSVEQVTVDEARVRWQLNEDAIANETLAEGIGRFDADTVKLSASVREHVARPDTSPRDAVPGQA
jgi:transaldolase